MTFTPVFQLFSAGKSIIADKYSIFLPFPATYIDQWCHIVSH